MWDWEIADEQGKLHKHASAELRKTGSMNGLDLGSHLFNTEIDSATEPDQESDSKGE